MVIADYYDSLLLGHLKKCLDSRKEDLAVDPALRGGHSGCMYNGFVIGTNPKEAVLRYLKLQSPVDFDQRLLFDAGFGNEDAHNALLDAAGVPYKCEEKIPIKWETSNGYTVTGRPDRGILNADGNIISIIEEKQIASSWKTKTFSNWGDNQPKPENVAQAAHYMWQHRVDHGILAYTNRAWHALKAKTEVLANPNHRAILGSDEWTFGIKPFMAFYQLEWKGDTLYVNNTESRITKGGIEEYYVMLGKCLTDEVIPEYHYKDIWGGTINKKKNEKYFEWADVPTESWTEWVDIIREQVNADWENLERAINDRSTRAQLYV